MNETLLARAFNAWMDEYINHPEEFTKMYENEMKHLKERLNGDEPTYGDKATATLQYYIDKVILE